MCAHRLSKSGFSLRITLPLGCSALAALSLIASRPSVAQGPDGPVVAVTGGQVQGQRLPAPGGAVFKGIPYAAPPVGDLRWRETQPVKPWTGVLQTVKYSAACPQLPGASQKAKE